MSGLLAIALLIIMVLGTLVVYLWRSNKTKEIRFEFFTEEIADLKGQIHTAHVLINKLKLRINEYERRKRS